MSHPWLDQYPPGVPHTIDVSGYASLNQLLDTSFKQNADRPFSVCMERWMKYSELDDLSRGLGAWLQKQGLEDNARVALMLPNVPTFAVSMAGILRAGYTCVNVNPLYTARELEHQLQDSGAKAMVVIENFGSVLQQCLANTPVQHVILCAMGDQLSWLKGCLVNHVVRKVKNLVPPFQLPHAVRFNQALALDPANPLKPDAAPFQQIEQITRVDNVPGIYDAGFYNIGLRTASEALGVGRVDPYGTTLSYARQFLMMMQFLRVPDEVKPPFCIPEPPIPVNPLLPPDKPKVCTPLTDGSRAVVELAVEARVRRAAVLVEWPGLVGPQIAKVTSPRLTRSSSVSRFCENPSTSLCRK